MSSNQLKNRFALLTNWVFLVLIACILIISLLPLHFSYNKNLLLLFVSTSAALFLTFFLNLFCKYVIDKENLYSVLILFSAFIIYCLFQILPIPSFIMSVISPASEAVWQNGVYGLTDYSAISLDISGSIWMLILCFCYISVFFLTMNFTKSMQNIFIIIFILFALGIYQIAFDIISKYMGYFYVSASEIDGHTYRLTGTFINSNNVSALINISISSGVALLVLTYMNLQSNRSICRYFIFIMVLFGLLILFYGSIKAGSAGGFLSLLCSFFLIGLYILKQNTSPKILFSIFSFIIFLIFLLVFFQSKEINLTELTIKLSLSERPILWKDILTMWLDFKFFGIGIGAFEWIFPAFKSDQVSPLRIINAHSSYLQLLVESGLVGLLIILLFYIEFFRKVFHSFNNKMTIRYVVCVLLIGVFAYLIHEGVENNFLVPGVTIPYFALMGVIMSLIKIHNYKDTIK